MSRKSLGVTAVILALLLAVSAFLIIIRMKNPDKENKETPDVEAAFLGDEAEQETNAPQASANAATEEKDREQEKRYLERANEIISGMSINQKICQLFMAVPDDITGVKTITSGEQTKDALANYPVGGLYYRRANLISKEQAKEMIETSQSYAPIKMFICTDEEGGNITRLMKNIGTTEFNTMYSYKDDGEDKAYSNAKTIATDMKALGFNLDLAPVADVWSNPENTVIAERAYSDDFRQASTLITSAIQGFHDGGVLCCIKHFPGHGDTATDTHSGPSIVNKSRKELFKQELLPFKAGIAAGADMVMIGHMTVQAFDDKPSTISYNVITKLLREKLNYDGVVITDALEMAALSNVPAGDIAVQSINAGADIMLCSTSFKALLGGINRAVANGTISEERINQSVMRIIMLKLKTKIIE
ncbi:MAG: glycoside hydrolase family 3 N-terminal domain-containing protein [Oscillospiraceae bacterium]